MQYQGTYGKKDFILITVHSNRGSVYAKYATARELDLSFH
jgi:hypothetical protein